MAGAAIPIVCGAVGTQGGRRGGHAPDRHLWISDLIRQEGPAILRMLWRLLANEQDVMDAYQDCFCKLASRVDYRDVNSARAYAYRTASNVAIEMIRVRRRRATHWPRIVREFIDEPMPHPGGESPDDVDADSKPGIESAQSSQASGELTRLREALALLPAHLQHVIVLRDLTGMSYEKVGACLGIEPTTARVYRRHAVVKLAELLDVRGADHERDNQGP